MFLHVMDCSKTQYAARIAIDHSLLGLLFRATDATLIPSDLRKFYQVPMIQHLRRRRRLRRLYLVGDATRSSAPRVTTMRI